MDETVDGKSLEKAILDSARRGRVVNYLIAAIVLFFFVWAMWEWYNNRDNPHVDSVVISNESHLTHSLVCPGETLVSSFDISVEGEGILIRDSSIQRIKPAQVIIFSEPQRYPITGPITQSVVLSWKVPINHFDFATGEMVRFPPGEYLHNFSVSSLSGRDPAFDMISLPFTVTEGVDCERKNR